MKSEVLLEMKKLSTTAITPTYAHENDAGMDLYSDETYVLKPMERKLFSTGIAINIPTGYEIQLRPRSGNAYKFGITVLNSPATIDAGYLNEYKVLLINLSDVDYEIKSGDRIAQMVFAPVYHMSLTEVTEFAPTERGLTGFGDSGK